MSSNKVKGLLKGFKKLNIFDEKEDGEIEIGFPTDVKHVAHIGLDGPSASTPTWMADIQRAPGAPEIKPTPTPPTPTPNTNDTPQDKLENNETTTKGDGIRKVKDIPKSKGDGSKASRQHRSSDPTSESSTRHSRRNRQGQGQGGDSSLEETNGNVAPKRHRRRKSKATNGDESVKSSRRPKGHSMTDIPLLDNESVEGSVHCESPVLTKVA